jgi:hypothetical protein
MASHSGQLLVSFVVCSLNDTSSRKLTFAASGVQQIVVVVAQMDRRLFTDVTAHTAIVFFSQAK